MRYLLHLAIVALIAASAYAADLTRFEPASEEAVRLYGTPEGHAYMLKFLDAMNQSIAHAMQDCMPGIKGRKTDIRYEVVFIVAKDGRIERILRSSDEPVAVCFTRKFEAPKHLPLPPHDHWPVVNVIVHGP